MRICRVGLGGAAGFVPQHRKRKNKSDSLEHSGRLTSQLLLATGRSSEVNVTAVPLFDDWLELLGLDSVMTALLAGTISADAAEDAIRAQWESYPDVSQDYVAILEQALYSVDAVRLSIDVQQEAVARFNEAANGFMEASNEIELRFDHEPGRLMTSDEEVEFERLGEMLRTRTERAERELAELVREAEQLQVEVQADSDEGQKGI